ncbi:SRPBCC family protein [Changchengzhania lutea]|uniref:SRPBCC family protein n=1 Tax=Changchengzhania lutea TaxID=2049305 RepID=UPI00115E184D|nr:SRPBCC family protein [Changchengzhania lutea]
MTKSEQQVIRTIDVTPEQAWEIIGSGKDVDKWFPEMIKSCRLEGTTRVCGLEQGELIEEILKIDHENKEFKYTFIKQSMIPNIHNIVGNTRVMADENGKAVINWRWTFDCEDPESENEAKEAFKGAGNMGILGIEKFILERKRV